MNELVKIVITKLYISDKKKDGVLFLDKNGNPYKRVAIQTSVHGDSWLSSFSFRDNDEMRSWQVGQEVEVLVSRNGEYWNFRVPTKADLLEERVSALEKKIEILTSPTFVSSPNKTIGIESVNKELTAEDLPF